jgi:hypothetical protein
VRVQVSERGRKWLQIAVLDRSQRRIAVGEFVAQPLTQMLMGCLFVRAGDDQLARIACQGVGANQRQRALGIALSVMMI